MKYYLQSFLPDLKRYSALLDNITILTEKTWTVSNGPSEFDRFIFKKNHTLVLVRKGEVTLGHWEYVPSAKALLISYTPTEKFFYQHGYLDRAVMILKKDAKDEQYLVLVDEQVIPHLDAKKYLEKLRYKKYNITTLELADQTNIEVARDYNDAPPCVGDKVFVAGQPLPDGQYQLKKSNELIEVKESRIARILTIREYQLLQGIVIEVQQQAHDNISEGDRVQINGLPAPDGTYAFNDYRNLVIQGGKVVSLPLKSFFRKGIWSGIVISLLVLLIGYLGKG